MTIQIWLLIALVMIICGTLTYGMCFAFFQKGWPRLAKQYYKQDILWSIFYSLFGPIGLIGIFVGSDYARHGLLFKYKER